MLNFQFNSSTLKKQLLTLGLASATILIIILVVVTVFADPKPKPKVNQKPLNLTGVHRDWQSIPITLKFTKVLRIKLELIFS